MIDTFYKIICNDLKLKKNYCQGQLNTYICIYIYMYMNKIDNGKKKTLTKANDLRITKMNDSTR